MKIKKGTTTVGLVCKDGIILAADRRATAGTLIVDKKAQKVHIINEYSAATMAGAVADAQLLVKLLRAEVKLKSVRTERKPTIKEIANLLGGLLYSNIRRFSIIPGVTHFLLGGYDKSGTHLYDLYPDGSVTEVTDYTSSGSGSVIAYGVLEAQYSENMPAEEATRLAVKAVNAALQRDSATGNGIDAIKITTKGVEKVFGATLEPKAEYR